jgi:CheY-like chemotaxis protein
LRRGFLDGLLAGLGLAPFRCRVCRERFYRIWQPFEPNLYESHVPVLVMPRTLLMLDSIEPDPLAPSFIQLPAEPERTLPRLVEPAAVKKVRFVRPRSILILEGDLSIRRLLRRLLDRRGYFTYEVPDPADLPTELRGRRIDLLIVDASLMGPNGESAAFALAQDHPELKILALSPQVSSAPELPDRCLTLTKPFSLDSFIQCVDGLFELAE